MNPELLKAIDPVKYYSKFLDAGIRGDGRDSLHAARTVNVVPDVIGRTIGSAGCTIGETSVIVGITAGVFSLPDGIVTHSFQGKVTVSTDLSLSIPERKIAQPAGLAISSQVQTVVDQVLDRSQLTVDMVKPEPLLPPMQVDEHMLPLHAPQEDPYPVWDLQIHAVVVVDDGSLVDALIMATVAALQRSSLPVLDEKLHILRDQPSRKLELRTIPVPLSVSRYRDNQLFLDPTKNEETLFGKGLVVLNKEGTDVLFTDIEEAVPLVQAQIAIRLNNMLSSL